MPPKSILKKPLQPVIAQINKQGPLDQRTPRSRNYTTAAHHASLLQDRKDTEATVLAALEELLAFPTDPLGQANRPLQADLARFQHLIQPFTPSDYDELFLERNCTGRCAYVFCSKDHVQEPNRGPVRLVRCTGGEKGFKPMTATQAEMWCGRECARRAMFIKVQLSETPAWERVGGKLRAIQVLDEGSEKDLEQRSEAVRIDGAPDSTLQEAMQDLAFERGGKTANEIRLGNYMLPTVKETRADSQGRPSFPTQT